MVSFTKLAWTQETLSEVILINFLLSVSKPNFWSLHSVHSWICVSRSSFKRKNTSEENSVKSYVQNLNNSGFSSKILSPKLVFFFLWFSDFLWVTHVTFQRLTLFSTSGCLPVIVFFQKQLKRKLGLKQKTDIDKWNFYLVLLKQIFNPTNKL